MMQAARDDMQNISRQGGELEVAADKIALCRPLMAAAREQLSVSLEEFREKIQNHFSVSADTFLDALSTLSMAPEGFTAIVQAADVIHKSWSKIEDDQGNLVNKAYVVKQIRACQGSFASLAKTYEDLDASELQVDDPGFSKISTTADNLKKILNEFEEQVSVDTVRTKLDAYLEVVQKRNAAVINYNGLIQSYLQLQRVIQSCKEEFQQLGEQALQLNPSLPAIYVWLKRLRGQTRLQILRELNNQARALSFWGPMPVNSVSFLPPGPKTGYIELQSNHDMLIDLFESSYEGFQSGGWSSWPADGTFSGKGVSVPLSQDVLDNLKRERGGQAAWAHDSESLLTITPESHTDFLDMANVRLTQVRVWLLGATIGTSRVSDGDMPRRALRIEITHCGDDTIWDPDGSPCRFRHAPVTMQFSYETTLFNASGGERSGRPGLVYSRQDIEHDYDGGSSRPGATDKPPIGPFGDWKLEIRKDVNVGLDLQSVTAGWIEFCGRNQVAKSPLREVEG
ncbi:serine protein kinase [Fusarium bulbicola]|nr:serine protein kinase [Fusarium bulbicola]